MNIKRYAKISMLILVLCFTPIKMYADSEATATAPETTAIAPEQIIPGIIDKVMELRENSELTAEQKYEEFHQLLHQYVDVEKACKSNIGRAWRAISEEDKNQIVSVYSEYIVLKTMGLLEAFIADEGRLEMRRAKANGKYYFIEYNYHNGDPTPISIIVSLESENETDYKIHDYVVEGFSQKKVESDEARSIISVKGIEGYIEDLISTVDKLKEEQL